MAINNLAAAACILLTAASATQAATFDFYWSSAGSVAGTLGTDATVSGTFDIEVQPGETFTASDFSNIDLTLSTVGFEGSQVDAHLSVAFFTEGSISFKGDSLVFTQIAFVSTFGDDGFQCNATLCEEGYVDVIHSYGRGLTELHYYRFDDALASFETSTVSSVPLPANALLVLSSLGGLAALKRRKRRAASLRTA